ncbi:cytochrome c oxidase subunit 3 [Methylobacterium segetis]|uniref:cytochrome c oxidase subunit 3 n=1 Tax=Methylobacterium segetis TaxID=2488750 RepID=UPI00104CAFA0|nr:cytochrome-c oxidase [Methylobacterium segetis]
MTLVLLYLAVLAALSARWLSRQRLASKPWLETGMTLGVPAGPHPVAPARLGLAVLLAAIGLLFALLVAAYTMRVPREAWQTLPDPGILWSVTGLLALASVALHGAVRAASRGERDGLLLALAAAGTATAGFFAWQWLAWRRLLDLGAGPGSDAAAAFFYLLTALHGLHVAGGVAALAVIAVRALRAADPRDLRPAAFLCAVYLDALLAIWLVLFGVLYRTPWSGWILALCGPL